ncbi:MAG: ferritin-like domain-containing protein [Deltaproteobacteria bacterium]|nr:ferritin-like domain-containing protein [Deltaproteobacteria bacterium]MBW2396817.1 ferritin-like domain-containing protein [Deltaproteobacteria bacterium]
MPVEEIVANVKTLWKFDYEPKIKALRDLYEVAKREQWNAATDVPWDLEIDASGDILDPSQDAFRELDAIKALPEKTQTELSVQNAAWILSQFLHGEQGAMLCCGQLVEAVPDIDGKLYAATQVIDEARHVEVFHRYLTRLHHVYPIDPTLQAVLNQILEADLWQMKCVGMQVIVEGLAMGSFKIMKEGSRDELLRSIVELTAQDEARHVSYGLIYMKDELPRMPEPDRDRVEDFAFAAVDAISGRRPGTGFVSQMAILEQAGVDPAAVLPEIQTKFTDPEFIASQPDPIRDHVLPQLGRIGLITDRTASRYRELGFEV